MQARNTYIAKMKEELDKLDVRLHELELAAENMQEDTRERYKLEVKKVREQSELAKEKMSSLLSKWAESSEESWDAMVLETEKIRDAFVKSFHYFKSQI